jgi:hypothetical protein
MLAQSIKSIIEAAEHEPRPDTIAVRADLINAIFAPPRFSVRWIAARLAVRFPRLFGFLAVDLPGFI